MFIFAATPSFPRRGGGLFRPSPPPDIFHDKIVFQDTWAPGLVGKLTEWQS